VLKGSKKEAVAANTEAPAPKVKKALKLKREDTKE
jgi:hypothetical protein